MSGFSGTTEGGVLHGYDVIDNLTSTATNQPLSANMGKTLNDNLTASSVTVTPNSTYISSTQISCVKNNYIANLSGWFNANANIPSNGAIILSNLPAKPNNLYSNRIKVLLVNQTTGGVYHCRIDGTDLKTDYNRENIPSGEYRIISFMYLLK